MEVAEVSSKEAWRAKGVDQDEVRKDIKTRLGGAMSIVDELIEDAGDWFLYPVYRIPPKGSWATEKVMLLGDAAYSKYSDGRWPGSRTKYVLTCFYPDAAAGRRCWNGARGRRRLCSARGMLSSPDMRSFGGKGSMLHTTKLTYAGKLTRILVGSLSQ